MGLYTSQSMRATPFSRGRHGITWNVSGSGTRLWSDSLILAKPSIEEPSNIRLPSRAFSSSSGVTLTLFKTPKISINCNLINSIPSFSTLLNTCCFFSPTRFLPHSSDSILVLLLIIRNIYPEIKQECTCIPSCLKLYYFYHTEANLIYMLLSV